jgi:hypothetical protein
MLSAFGNGQISPKRYIHAAYKWGCRSMRTPNALIGLIMLVGSGFASAAQPLSGLVSALCGQINCRPIKSIADQYRAVLDL